MIPEQIARACAVLGVSPDATAAEVKRAYRELCRAYHPDYGGSHERQVEINAAYACLLPWVKQGRPAVLVDDGGRWARWSEAVRRRSEEEAARRQAEWEAQRARQEEIRRNTRVYTSRETADLIKAALAAAFPDVTFHVTISHPRSHWAAEVTVTWVDGPSHWDVKAVTDAYAGRESCDIGGEVGFRDRIVPDGEGRWKRYDIYDIRLQRWDSDERCPACGSFQRRRGEIDEATDTLLAVCATCGHRWPMYHNEPQVP